MPAAEARQEKSVGQVSSRPKNTPTQSMAETSSGAKQGTPRVGRESVQSTSLRGRLGDTPPASQGSSLGE